MKCNHIIMCNLRINGKENVVDLQYLKIWIKKKHLFIHIPLASINYLDYLTLHKISQ